MAITVDWGTQVITVPQADLTFISGTLYEMDTDAFRLTLKDLEDDAEGMPFLDTHRHNTEVTVAGVTYARTVEIINGYSVTFTPDSQWTVRLVGSNNNIFDVENGILNQNQVQVIPTNSAGLISVSVPSSLPADILDNEDVETGLTVREALRLIAAATAGKLSGAETTTITIRNAVADSDDRIVATVDGDGNRTDITYDLT